MFSILPLEAHLAYLIWFTRREIFSTKEIIVRTVSSCQMSHDRSTLYNFHVIIFQAWELPENLNLNHFIST